MTMSIEERVALIRRARDLVQAAATGSGLPQIEAILRSADMELHWALWNLGEAVTLRSEFDWPESAHH
jgi:hypothetical protein